MSVERNYKRTLRKMVMAKFDNRCAYCGDDIELVTFQIDHLMPVSKGGSDDFENLYPSCRSCNSSKRAKSLEDFRNHVGWSTLRDMLDCVIATPVLDRIAELVPELLEQKDEVEFYFEKAVSRSDDENT